MVTLGQRVSESVQVSLPDEGIKGAEDFSQRSGNVGATLGHLNGGGVHGFDVITGRSLVVVLEHGSMLDPVPLHVVINSVKTSVGDRQGDGIFITRGSGEIEFVKEVGKLVKDHKESAHLSAHDLTLAE